jgi:xanthine/uracil permease
VIGGMTTFLFCNVFVSGVKMVNGADLNSRRNRVILALSMGIGLGVAMVPNIFADFRASDYTGAFWPCKGPFRDGGECTDSEKAIRNGVIIFLSTPYSVGTTLALVLNLILPDYLEVLRLDTQGVSANNA